MDGNAANQNLQPNTDENFASSVKEENNETAFNQDITKNEYLQGQGEVVEKNAQLDEKEVTRASNEITNMEKIMGDVVQLVQRMNSGMTVKIEKSDEKKFHIEYTEALNDKIKIENNERVGDIFKQDQDINLHSTINAEHFNGTKDAECNMELPFMKIENSKEGETFQGMKIFSTVDDEVFDESHSLSLTELNMELSYNKIKDAREGDIFQQDQDTDIDSTGNTEPLAEIKAAESNMERCGKFENVIDENNFEQDQDTDIDSTGNTVLLAEIKAAESNMEHCDTFENAIGENNFQQDQDTKTSSPVDDDSFDKTKGTKLNRELPCDNIENKIEDVSQHDQDMNSYSAVNIVYFNEIKDAESNMELSHEKIENIKEEDIFQQDPDMKIFSTVNVVEPFDESKVTDGSNRELPYGDIDNTIQEDILQHDQAMNIHSTFNTETLDETNDPESYKEPSDKIEDTREEDILEHEQDITMIVTVENGQFDETRAIESNIEALNNKSTSDLDTNEDIASEEDQGMVNNDTVNMDKLKENTGPEPSIDTVDNKTTVKPETKEEAILQHDQEKDNQVMAIEAANFTERSCSKGAEKFKIFNKIKGWFKNSSEGEESEEGDIDEELKPTHYFAEDGSVKTVDLSKKSRRKN